MSVERHREHTERHEQDTAQLEAAAKAAREHLRHSLETTLDNAEQRAEAAREIINKKSEQAPEPPPAPEAAPKPISRLLNPKLNYAHTLASLQRQLKPVSRGFSKFIHMPLVERTSDIVERTVARPSVTLGATWTALIVGGVFYLTARYFGYALSGSELLFSFIVGALIGLVFEALWRAFNHH